MVKQNLHTGGEKHLAENIRVLFHESGNTAVGSEETKNSASGGRETGKAPDQPDTDSGEEGGQPSGKKHGRQKNHEKQIDAEAEEKKPGETAGKG